MRCSALTNGTGAPLFQVPSAFYLSLIRPSISLEIPRSRKPSLNPTVARPTPSSSLFIMEEDGEATGPTMAAEVEMAKEMKQNNYGRALEIFSAASTKNVRSACQPLRTVL